MTSSSSRHPNSLIDQFAPRWTFRSLALAMTATLSIYMMLPYLEQLSAPIEADLIIRSIDSSPVPPPPVLPAPMEPESARTVNTPKPTLIPPVQKPSLPNPSMNLQVAIGDLQADPFPSFDISDATLSAQLSEMIYEFSTLDTPPSPITRLQPIYPGEARRRGIEGFATLEFIVEPDGSTRDARIVDSSPGDLFDDAAILAVRRWRFSPGLKNGQAVTTRVRQTVNFTIK